MESREIKFSRLSSFFNTVICFSKPLILNLYQIRIEILDDYCRFRNFPYERKAITKF